MEFRVERLPSGLTVVAEINPDAYVTAVGYFVRSGARDEAAGVSGVSHFLEHMAFKGTDTRSATDINRQLDRLGAMSNAQTGQETTIYYAQVLPEFQDEITELLGDMLVPALREEDFQLERKVILEEIQMYRDQPPYGADDFARKRFFGDHPLGQSILGSPESIEGLTAEAMRAYHGARYAGPNVILAAAGQVDFARLVDVARRATERVPSSGAGRDVTPPGVADGVEVLVKDSSRQEYLMRSVPGPSIEDDLRYAARTLAAIVGDNSGSRYYWDLLDPGLAEYAAFHVSEYADAGVMTTYLAADPAYIPEILSRIDAIHASLVREGIGEHELQRAKNTISADLLMAAERTMTRMFSVGKNWLRRGVYEPPEVLTKRYQAITQRDLTDLLERFPLEPALTVAVGPMTELETSLAATPRTEW